MIVGFIKEKRDLACRASFPSNETLAFLFLFPPSGSPVFLLLSDKRYRSRYCRRYYYPRDFTASSRFATAILERCVSSVEPLSHFPERRVLDLAVVYRQRAPVRCPLTGHISPLPATEIPRALALLSDSVPFYHDRSSSLLSSTISRLWVRRRGSHRARKDRPRNKSSRISKRNDTSSELALLLCAPDLSLSALCARCKRSGRSRV